jgi:hypothetical protein
MWGLRKTARILREETFYNQVGWVTPEAASVVIGIDAAGGEELSRFHVLLKKT